MPSSNDYLQTACEKLPVVKQTLHEYGDSTLGDYIERFNHSGHVQPFQSRDDLFGIIEQYGSLFADTWAVKKIIDNLASNPVVLTANHQGVDYFAQSIQGTLIFALNHLLASQASLAPVFAFGNIPLNNLTYPRGMLLYRAHQTQSNKMPLKTPLFPDRLKRRMVSHTPPFDQEMVDRLKKRLNQMALKKKIAPGLEAAAVAILENHYSDPEVLKLPDYSRQSTFLNTRIWNQLFENPKPSVDLIYLEIEKIVAQLLLNDLKNGDSLAFKVMFEDPLCEKILEALDGVTGCWEYETLQRRLDSSVSSQKPIQSNQNPGTVFFWGIDASGRRIPLVLLKNKVARPLLRGISDSGKEFEVAFTSQSILGGLQKGDLLPSLFTCFLTVAFARGLVCIGGYHQGQYLPLIKKGLITAFHQANGYGDVINFIDQTSASGYLSGMLAVMTEIFSDGLAPAGPVEIIAAGGLTRDEIERMRALSVREAHLAGLFETVPDIYHSSQLNPDWRLSLARECKQALSAKVVVK